MEDSFFETQFLSGTPALDLVAHKNRDSIFSCNSRLKGDWKKRGAASIDWKQDGKWSVVPTIFLMAKNVPSQTWLFFPQNSKRLVTLKIMVSAPFFTSEKSMVSLLQKLPKIDFFSENIHSPQKSWLSLLRKTQMEIDPASNTFAPKKVFLMQKMYSSRLQQFALKEVIFALIESTEFCSKTVH